MTTVCTKLTLLSLLWLVVINTGSFGTQDTQLRLRMANAWWTGGPEVSPTRPPPKSREDITHGVIGASGKRLIFYDPGQSLLMLPGDWLAIKLIHWVKASDPMRWRTEVIDRLVFLPLNLALVLACFGLLRLLGFDERLAALTSLVWLLGTTVLPYAQVAFQNNQVLLFVIAAHAAILGWVRTQRLGLVALSGAAAGAALLLRTSSVVHVFTLGLFLLACIIIGKQGRGPGAKVVTYWLAGFVPIALCGRIFDYGRYGSLFTTGQSVWIRQVSGDPVYSGLPPLPPDFPFTHPAHVGIFGVLFSPAKSLFIYDPLLLPCLAVCWLSWKTLTPYMRWFVLLAILNISLHIWLTSRLDFWHGDWAWAARYHVTSVDLLLIGLLPLLLQRVLTARPAVAYTLRAVILLAISVQLLAVSMPVAAEIGSEVLQDPASCGTDTWHSRLEFRLGNRIMSLYCLATGSGSPDCPLAVAKRAASDAGPACAADLEALKQQTTLAFFPFDPANQPRTAIWCLFLWVGTLLLATAWTGSWFYRAVRTFR